jgi:hypothetical protein
MNTKTICLLGAFAAAACMLGVGSQAQAAMITFQVYVQNAGGNWVTQMDSVTAGNAINVRLYALLPDNQSNTGLNTFKGSLVSAAVAGSPILLGNLATGGGTGAAAVNVNALFTTTRGDGASADIGDPSADRKSFGAPDGDLDIGAVTHTSATGLIQGALLPSNYVLPTDNSSVNAALSHSILLYSTTFTPASGYQSGQQTLLEFVPTYGTGIPSTKTVVIGEVDGTTFSFNGDDLTDVGVAGTTAGTAIPEPATLALLGLGGLVSLIRRRRA